MMVRFDAWLLPFLNIYGLGGYIWNTSRVDVTVDLPGAPDTQLEGDPSHGRSGGSLTSATVD